MPVQQSPELRIGSLCSGYGGLELGLMAVVGGSVAWHVEHDKHPSAVLEARFPGVPNYGDVTSTDWTQVEPVDWLTSGYPCQPFSHAGKRKGSADERHLWPAVADAIGVLRPRRVLLENVAGHVSLGLDAVLADLAALGYDATWGVVRAADAGAPHRRERIFIVARDAQSDDKWHVGLADSRRPGRAPQPSRGTSGAPADTNGERHQRSGSARRRWGGPPDDRDAAPDANGTAGRVRQRLGQAAGSRGRGESEARADLRSDARRGDCTPANPDGGRFGFSAKLNGDPTQAPADGDSCGEHTDGPAGAVAWGAYEPAVRRWERISGRSTPRPTEQGRTGERLNPRFVEWLMGLPDGWVTDVLSRNPALKALGNGCVPQQAALAVRTLLSIEAVAA